MTINLRKITQGERGTLTFTWEFPENLSSPASISGAVITATMTDEDGVTTAVSGTLTGTAATTCTWALSAGDSGTAGTFTVLFRAIVTGVTTYTLEATLEVIANPAVTGTQNDPLVSISAADAAWVTLAATAVPDGGDIIPDAPSDGTQYARQDGDWAAVNSVSDVGDLTTAGLTVANMLRVAAAGGLEERTPQQVASAVEGFVEVGTSQIVHDNSLLTGLAFCFPLGEPEGIRFDKVGGYQLADNNTVTQGSGVQGQAALFTAATTEFFSATSAAQYQITAAQTSFTYWINHTNTALMCPVSKYGGTANEYIIQNSTNNNVRVNTYGTPDTSLIHTATLLPGYWYFIHVFFDITNSLIGIQVNNGVAQTAAVTSINASNSEFRIGQYNNARYMNGKLWQVCKWNRLLTALELSNLYNGGNGILYPFS